MLRPGIQRVLQLAVLLLFAQVLWQILMQYPWYFPPNFNEAAFLIGREDTFQGLYAVSFYVHLASGPIALVAATIQVIFPDSRWHKQLGKAVVAIVVLGVVPSGFVMAWGTLFGPVAQLAFQTHALFTLCCCVMAVQTARVRNISHHQQWSQSLLVLLYAPLVFRLVSGTAIVMDCESPKLYVVNAWACWIVPWCALECYRRISNDRRISMLQSKRT